MKMPWTKEWWQTACVVSFMLCVVLAAIWHFAGRKGFLLPTLIIACAGAPVLELARRAATTRSWHDVGTLAGLVLAGTILYGPAEADWHWARWIVLPAGLLVAVAFVRGLPRKPTLVATPVAPAPPPPEPQGPADPCYILCTRHSRSTDGAFLWRLPKGYGYTTDLDQAGIYSLAEERRRQCADIPVPVERVRGATRRVLPLDADVLREEWHAVAKQFVDRDRVDPVEQARAEAAIHDADDPWALMDSTPEPVCPWCGARDSEWYHGHSDKHQGDVWFETCNCDKPYAVEVVEERLGFRTVKIDDQPKTADGDAEDADGED